MESIEIKLSSLEKSVHDLSMRVDRYAQRENEAILHISEIESLMKQEDYLLAAKKIDEFLLLSGY